MRFFLALVLLGGGLSVPSVVYAESFSFSALGSGGGFGGSGTLVTTAGSTGPYTITDISGTGVGGLIATGMFPGSGNDNLLYPGMSPLLDGSGFGFTDSANGELDLVKIFSQGAAADGTAVYMGTVIDTEGDGVTTPVEFSIADTTVPEPGSLMLLGTGAMGLAGCCCGGCGAAEGRLPETPPAGMEEAEAAGAVEAEEQDGGGEEEEAAELGATLLRQGEAVGPIGAVGELCWGWRWGHGGRSYWAWGCLLTR